jgi:hypothetical protein
MRYEAYRKVAKELGMECEHPLAFSNSSSKPAGLKNALTTMLDIVPHPQEVMEIGHM